MGSFDRSKKRVRLWKKALFHFFLCFFMGFFLGFAPSGTASIFSNQQAAAYNNKAMIRLQATSLDAIPTVDERVDLEAPILTISPTGAGATAPMPAAAAESHAASDEQDAPAAANRASVEPAAASNQWRCRASGEPAHYTVPQGQRAVDANNTCAGSMVVEAFSVR